MIIDGMALDVAELSTPVCIIGGGLAGLVIARELERANIECLVLESGGYDPDPDTSNLYRGESIGIPYDFADGCRSRYLGGSSNCWGGWCRPMDVQDYQRRSWIAHSGWPFGPEELAPYYARIPQVLQTGSNNFDPKWWIDQIGRRDVRRLPLNGNGLIDGMSQFSPPLQAGKAYRDDLRTSTRITVVLHANVTDIRVSDNAEVVERVQVETLQRQRFSVAARLFILATGGIENARLLLASRSQRPEGIGNAHDLVGRFFMDHPRITSGWVRFSPEWKNNKLYDNKFQHQNDAVAADGTRVAAQFSATYATQERLGLSNARIAFNSIFPGEYAPAGMAMRKLRRRYEGAESVDSTLRSELLTVARHPITSAGFVAARASRFPGLVRGVRMQATVEAVPDPESRVTLSPDRCDALGMPRVRVNWKLDSTVRRTFDTMFALMKEAIEANHLGTVDLDPPIGDGPWPSTFDREGNWHHMGTTRMHDSPRQGVVDRNCLVHGMKNLYLAGSSVFPTASSDFPTITLTALALRLTDHIVRHRAGDLSR